MPNKAEKARRRAIVQEISAREYAQAYAQKPITDHVLLELFKYLDGALFQRQNGTIVTRCDHTFKRCREFLAEAGIVEIDTVCEWFGEYGGYCDCEVAYNVADYWNEKLRRT
jgi:hypothetical protein